MGLRCFLVFMFMIHAGFALECHNVFSVDKTTCDECIRCGGIWCQDPKEAKQCKSEMGAKDGWCPDDRYEIKNEESYSQPGRVFKETYVEKTAQPSLNPPLVQLQLLRPPGIKGVPKPRFEFLNNTSPNNFKINLKLHQDAGKYMLDVTTTIDPDVCSTKSKSEDVYVRVGISGTDETVTLKYHVVCACDCSDEVQVDSLICNGFGNYTCGSCQCNDEKHGSFCEKKYCPPRGDVSQSCVNSSPNEQCWGNGKCDECHKCQCDNNVQIQGSQYFDPENDCIDLCSLIKDTDCLFDCLKNNQEGPCETDPMNGLCHNGLIQKWNESLLEDQYDPYRKLWVNCSVTVESEVVEYSATKIIGVIHMMRKDVGTFGAVVAGPGNGATISVVIGVIAALAAMVAAAAGYVVWKGKSALPMTGSNYSNIEADNAVIENPLYKCPTSSFKNPMFGKS